jgi:hypothetical protein
MKGELPKVKLSFVELLNAYRQLWSNRSLANDQNLNDESSQQLLLETIEKELRDEMTHPRVRQSPEVKFYIALKRIMLSSLSDHEKLELIKLHLEVMNKISHY